MDHKGYIYFMTNPSNKVLYIGVTKSLKRRISEHAEGQGSAFTSKYNCSMLVYYEAFPDIEQAIAREKQLKLFKRAWKDKLVNSLPPQVVMKWTGHSDYKFMKPYIGIATRTKSDAMAKIAASWEEEE